MNKYKLEDNFFVFLILFFHVKSTIGMASSFRFYCLNSFCGLYFVSRAMSDTEITISEEELLLDASERDAGSVWSAQSSTTIVNRFVSLEVNDAGGAEFDGVMSEFHM